MTVRPDEQEVASRGFRIYEWKLAALRQLARPFVAWKSIPRGGTD